MIDNEEKRVTRDFGRCYCCGGIIRAEVVENIFNWCCIERDDTKKCKYYGSKKVTCEIKKNCKLGLISEQDLAKQKTYILGAVESILSEYGSVFFPLSNTVVSAIMDLILEHDFHIGSSESDNDGLAFASLVKK